MDKASSPDEKRAKRASQETALAVRSSPRKRSTDTDEQSAMMPVKRGGGRGLKAVQTSHEEAKVKERRNGEKEESKTKVKEQKLFHARSNAHVETKVVTEDSRKKVGRNGTTTVTSSTRVTKVTYL